jgi:Ni,Fe-hydrogenase I small subunit
MAMTCEDREFETSKSLEPNIDKTCIACEEEPTIETDQGAFSGTGSKKHASFP